MANPRSDTLTLSAPVTNSFTTIFEVFNYSQASVQFIWTGLNASDASLMLRGSNKPLSNFQDILCSGVTATSGSGDHMMNIYQIGYSYMQAYINPGTATQGNFEIVVTRKSFA